MIILFCLLFRSCVFAFKDEWTLMISDEPKQTQSFSVSDDNSLNAIDVLTRNTHRCGEARQPVIRVNDNSKEWYPIKSSVMI